MPSVNPDKDSEPFVETDPTGRYGRYSELLGSGKVGRTAEEKLKRSLFGDDEGMLRLWWSILLVLH